MHVLPKERTSAVQGGLHISGVCSLSRGFVASGLQRVRVGRSTVAETRSGCQVGTKILAASMFVSVPSWLVV